MKDGIYSVSFSSSAHSTGEGLVVVKAGSVNGGDVGYLYIGHLTTNGDALSGQLEIKRWNQARVSIFGPLDCFALSLAGKADAANDTFRVSGGVAGQPSLTISIAGRLLSQAA